MKGVITFVVTFLQVVVSMTSVIKTVHVSAFALCEQVEWLFGTDSVLDGLVTARVDLERR